MPYYNVKTILTSMIHSGLDLVCSDLVGGGAHWNNTQHALHVFLHLHFCNSADAITQSDLPSVHSTKVDKQHIRVIASET